ncbi:hypothetical protein EDD11_002808 [Mortierella claussenii]|nr:hypothetical protein EDD11_002808 [Mortierella claussenii]
MVHPVLDTTTATNANTDLKQPPLNGSSTESLWYLAYGSNMNPKILTGRRKIIPLESRNVVIRDYWLSMDYAGVPFIEPCFASILKRDESRIKDETYARFVHDRCCYGQAFHWDEQHPERSYPPELQGVVHRITLRDWRLVVQSEGGWGHNVPTGYDHFLLDCTTVDSNEVVSAHVLLARPLTIRAQCQPSPRYKNLLTAGAAHYNLDPAYQAYLTRLIPYECVGVRPKLARLMFMIFNVPMMIGFAFLLRFNKGRPVDQHLQPPYWMAWYFDKATRFSNTAHDWFVAPILASGRSCTLTHAVKVRERIEMELRQDKSQAEHQARQEKEAEKDSKAVKAAATTIESVAE